MIETTCPGCGKHYRLKDTMAGKRAKCARCGGVIRVPQLSAPTLDASEPSPLADALDAAAQAETAKPDQPSVYSAYPEPSPMPPPPYGPSYGQAALPRGDSSYARSRLQPPAIILIVLALLGGVSTLYSMMNTLSGRNLQRPSIQSLTPQGQRTAQGIALIANAVIGLVQVVVLMGATAMTKRQNLRLAKTGSILACIPCLSPCCVMGIPFGIWALVVLNDPDVIAAFES